LIPVQAYFKPCFGTTEISESYFSEIMSFHLDRLLGFHRTPAVVPRFIRRQELEALAKVCEEPLGVALGVY